jgi:hypothetical protein
MICKTKEPEFNPHGSVVRVVEGVNQSRVKQIERQVSLHADKNSRWSKPTTSAKPGTVEVNPAQTKDALSEESRRLVSDP